MHTPGILDSKIWRISVLWSAKRKLKNTARLRQGYGVAAFAFPLRSKAKAGAGEGTRTLDILVGNETLYH